MRSITSRTEGVLIVRAKAHLVQKSPVCPADKRDFLLEQGTGIEPALVAWEATVLPIN